MALFTSRANLRRLCGRCGRDLHSLRSSRSQNLLEFVRLQKKSMKWECTPDIPQCRIRILSATTEYIQLALPDPTSCLRTSLSAKRRFQSQLRNLRFQAADSKSKIRNRGIRNPQSAIRNRRIRNPQSNAPFMSRSKRSWGTTSGCAKAGRRTGPPGTTF